MENFDDVADTMLIDEKRPAKLGVDTVMASLSVLNVGEMPS